MVTRTAGPMTGLITSVLPDTDCSVPMASFRVRQLVAVSAAVITCPVPRSPGESVDAIPSPPPPRTATATAAAAAGCHPGTPRRGHLAAGDAAASRGLPEAVPWSPIAASTPSNAAAGAGVSAMTVRTPAAITLQLRASAWQSGQLSRCAPAAVPSGAPLASPVSSATPR